VRLFGRRLHKEFLGGGLVIALGIAVLAQGRTYDLGSPSRMGPGFFPVALGAILALCGVAIAVQGWLAAPADTAARRSPEWRAWFLICFSVVAFILCAAHLGLVPATLAIVFISALADRENSWKSAFVLSLAMVAVGIVVFWWALKIDLPLFDWS